MGFASVVEAVAVGNAVAAAAAAAVDTLGVEAVNTVVVAAGFGYTAAADSAGKD